MKEKTKKRLKKVLSRLEKILKGATILATYTLFFGAVFFMNKVHIELAQFMVLMAIWFRMSVNDHIFKY